MNANEIRHRIGGEPGTDIRQEVMDLCEVVARLEAELAALRRAVQRSADVASCLANGIQPD